MSASATVEARAENGILHLEINRPEKRNAINDATRRALVAGLDRAGADPKIRVVVISGRGGRAFASGADLADRDATPTSLDVWHDLGGRRPQQAARALRKPVIAMIDGYCLGGGLELALAADIRIASDTSLFGFPEIRAGLVPGGGGTQLLGRVVGPGAAAWLVLTGDTVDARWAVDHRLVDQVVPAADLVQATRDLADRIARHSLVALGMAKGLLLGSAQLPLDHGLDVERDRLALLLSSEDAREGVRAFREGRKPVVRDR